MLYIAKTETTIQLEKLLWEHTRKRGTFGCFEVTIGWRGRERVDYLTYDTKGIWRFYEVKVSKQDFYSKAKVTFKGNFNYYVIPEDLYEEVKHDIPNHIGVIVSRGHYLTSIENAKRQDLAVDELVLKDSLIRSLYRETEKIYWNT